MNDKFYIEINYKQKNHDGERICGDVFLSRRLNKENRIIAVLSDGMGHGVKANILATLTSTMALNFTKEHKDFNKIAEIIMKTLPVCSERKISYSTFTIVDIDYDGKTSILEYDNPECIILRGSEVFDPQWHCIILDSEKNSGKELRSCSFYPQKEDRIIFYSDGVTQSGMGKENFLFGWGDKNINFFIKDIIKNDNFISAYKLADKVVNRANLNDNFHLKDDTSCAVIYYREPRKLLICTGPPYEKTNDEKLSAIVKDFNGKKIICGATTSDIIARELNYEIEDSFEFEDEDLPPISYMQGVDLVTEGILTLGKVTEILKIYNNNYTLGKGPADRIVKLIKESDQISFVIGTRINIAHQDPSLPVELEIRRTVVKRIAKLLETRFLKQVDLQFI
ncbi:MAG: SpoIIE family protein phosphatase [Bacteroidales bacterium]|nr:SpoIIE family protein phosphatase [Bacteroidales bacterium]